MAKVIEVFVKNRKVLTESPCFVRVEAGHPCAGIAPGVTYQEESVLSKDDQHALDIVRAIAKEKGLDVKVYNLSTTTGRLKARFKGVEKTPTILVGDKKIDGTIARDSILNALK